MNAVQNNMPGEKNEFDFKSFSDEHLLYHMIYTAVDIQPNGFFRYIPPLGEKRFNCMRAPIDRRINHYIETGVIQKVNFQEKGSSEGLSRFFRFVDEDMTNLLFAVHGVSVSKGPVVLGPGEMDEDLEAIKESLKGKKTNISDEKMNELSQLTYKIEPLPANVETKLDTRRRWTLLESNPIEGVVFEGFERGQLIEQVERKNSYKNIKHVSLDDIHSEDYVLKESVKTRVDAPKWETRSKRKTQKQATIFDSKSGTPIPIHEQDTSDESVHVRNEKVDVPETTTPSTTGIGALYDDEQFKIQIEDRPFDFLTKEDDSRVMALITETLTSNMKFLKELTLMLDSHKVKEQLQAVVDMKNRLEVENEQLRKQLKQEEEKRLQLQTVLNETDIRRIQLDMMHQFQNFLNLTPQEMYQRRAEYAKLIEQQVQSGFQPFVTASRNLRA